MTGLTPVLSAKGFPLTSVLRPHSAHKCKCPHGGKEHVDVFYFNNTVGARAFLEGRKLPEIEICWNSTSLFEDKLPRDLTGRNDRPLYEDLDTVGEAVSVLFKGTYWFHRVTKGDFKVLRDTYKLLHGGELVSNQMKQWAALKLSPKGVNHLRNILSTIDGMAIQILLAFPDSPKIQSWEYFDNMISCLYKHLLCDWVDKHSSTYISYYEKIKAVRGQIKEIAFSETRPLSEVNVPRDMTFLRLPISLMRDKSIRNMFRVSLLIQTRACGTPPPHVFMRTYEKFKATLTSPASPPATQVAAEIAIATKVVYERMAQTPLRDKHFLGVVRSSMKRMKVSLSDSAELNFGKKDGGKYEAFRNIVQQMGQEVPEIDLENGSPTGDMISTSAENIGTAVFHYCFAKAIRGEITDLMTVRAEGVLEPGKVRMITVSEISHAVLLHPISHLLLDVLALVPSSTSGVKAANHAFEFYKRLSHKNPTGSFIMDEKSIWVLSSDLETATDFANPYIVRIILNVFLGKHCLGIPSLYKILILKLLTDTRTVYSEIRKESFQTTRGCLMGDPVTKFVMHMLHLVGKEITLMALN